MAGRARNDERADVGRGLGGPGSISFLVESEFPRPTSDVHDRRSRLCD